MRISALPLLLAGLVACSDSPETGADTDTVDNDADNDSVENQDTQDSSESGDASDTASDVSVDVGPDDATDASETSDVDPDAPELTEPGTFVIGEAALPDEYVFKGVWAGEAGRIVGDGNDGIVASQSPEGEWQVLSRAEGAELLNAVHGSDGRHLWAVGKDGAILPGTVDSFGDTGACEDDSDCVDDDACTLESCEEGRCIAASTGANGCCGSTPGSWNFETGSFSPWVNVGAEQIGPFPWQVVNRPGRATSGTFALWFGNATLGTYGGGEHLAGVIQSPNVRLPSTGTATLKFNVFLDAETDPSFDTLAVEVQESGVITEVWHKRELARVPTGTFVAAEADLTPWRGKVVQLRIVFDSIDGTINDFEGPYLDDIRVETECTASGAASGAAQRWEAVLLSEQGMYYIDTQSITTQGSTKVAWTVLDYRSVQEGAEGANYRSMRAQVQINCKARLARLVHMTYYSGAMMGGAEVQKRGMLRDWHDIEADSPIARIARRVC
jgi:hypothetical protein